MAEGSNKTVIAALLPNIAIAISKFVGAAITGSSAMLSEGIHSVVDTGNQWLLLLGIKKSRKDPDSEQRKGFASGSSCFKGSFGLCYYF